MLSLLNVHMDRLMKFRQGIVTSVDLDSSIFSPLRNLISSIETERSFFKTTPTNEKILSLGAKLSNFEKYWGLADGYGVDEEVKFRKVYEDIQNAVSKQMELDYQGPKNFSMNQLAVTIKKFKASINGNV